MLGLAAPLRPTLGPHRGRATACGIGGACIGGVQPIPPLLHMRRAGRSVCAAASLALAWALAAAPVPALTCTGQHSLNQGTAVASSRWSAWQHCRHCQLFQNAHGSRHWLIRWPISTQYGRKTIDPCRALGGSLGIAAAAQAHPWCIPGGVPWGSGTDGDSGWATGDEEGSCSLAGSDACASAAANMCLNMCGGVLSGVQWGAASGKGTP